jgi:hypothetical protein
MDVSAVLTDAYSRIAGNVEQALDGLDLDAVVWQPEPGTNTIAWLVWHLTRVQDDHVSELAEHPQAWEAGGWAPRFGLEAGTTETGYGHSADQVRSVRPESVAVLLDYHHTVAGETKAFLGGLTAEALDRVIDTSYDPHVTMGVRLVSVIADNLQHAGQARFVRGIYERSTGATIG